MDQRYFYCVFTTHMKSIFEKEKSTDIFVEFHHFTKATTRGVLQQSVLKTINFAFLILINLELIIRVVCVLPKN